MAFFGREKFIHREAESVKELAGVVVGRLYAIIWRNTEIDNRNAKLNLAGETHDGEKTDGYKHSLAVGSVYQNVIKHSAHIFGHWAYIHLATAATAVVVGGIEHLGSKADGVYNFCLWQLFARSARIRWAFL